MLRAFWAAHTQRGFHRDDVAQLPEHMRLSWIPEEALAHAHLFARKAPPHVMQKMLHTNLHPLPFVGDLDQSDVFILSANPGFSPGDYIDEYQNPLHIHALRTGLSNGGNGFFPLSPISANTGAGQYWDSWFRSTIRDLASELAVDNQVARKLVIRRVSVIESFAYHSKNFPNVVLDNVTSSLAARSYVHALLARAAAGQVLIFAWRRSHFWQLDPDSPGVMFRPPRQAQFKYLQTAERMGIVNFLASRERERRAQV